MKKTLAIAMLNFRQAVREKIFVGVILFLVLLLALSIFLAVLSVGSSEKVVRSLGIAGLEISGILLVLFSFTLSFFKEYETSIVEVYLCHFSRRSYISGKLLGYIGVCALYLLLGSIGWSAILLLHGAFTWKIFAALYFLFWKLALLIALNQLFCLVFSSPIPAFLGTLFLYYTSEVCGQAAKMAAAAGNEVQAAILQVIQYILPNMELLDAKAHIAYAEMPEWSMFAAMTVYSLLYIGFLWIISQMLFAREEL